MRSVLKLVDTTQAQRSGRVNFPLEDAEKFVSDTANGIIGFEKPSKR